MPRISVFMLRAALIHLLIGTTFGGLLLANKALAFAPSLWRFLYAHAEFLLVGWMIQLVMGTATWILPRFASEPRYGQLRWAWTAFMLVNGAVLVVAYAYASGNSTLIAIGRVLELLGILCFVRFIAPRIKAFGQ